MHQGETGRDCRGINSFNVLTLLANKVAFASEI